MTRPSKRAAKRNTNESKDRAASTHRRLAWLLNFAEFTKSKIESLPANELSQLREEVWCFPERTMTQGGDDDLSIDIVAGLAVRLGSGLKVLMRGEPWRPSVGPTKLYLCLKGSEAQRSYLTSHADGFFLEAVELIATQANRLRRCALSHCRKLFAANRRQTFCSPACSQAERTKRFRERHKDELSTMRHGRYVAQVRRQKGLATAKKVRRRQPQRG